MHLQSVSLIELWFLRLYPPCFCFPALSIAYLFDLTRQTRSLLSVFEEDSGMLTNYTNQLLQALQRVFGAQVGNHIHTRGENVPNWSYLFQVGHISVPYLVTTGVINASVE